VLQVLDVLARSDRLVRLNLRRPLIVHAAHAIGGTSGAFKNRAKAHTDGKHQKESGNVEALGNDPSFVDRSGLLAPAGHPDLGHRSRPIPTSSPSGFSRAVDHWRSSQPTDSAPSRTRHAVFESVDFGGNPRCSGSQLGSQLQRSRLLLGLCPSAPPRLRSGEVGKTVSGPARPRRALARALLRRQFGMDPGTRAPDVDVG
jgi:hypothetical protein